MGKDINKTRFNQILFEGRLGWIPTPDGRGHCVDGSSLPFIIEEMVAHCAVEIVISSLSPASLFTDTLDSLLSRRVKVVPFKPVLEKQQALLEPLIEEFHVKFDGPSFSSACEDEEASHALSTIFFELFVYLTGLEYRAEVDVNIQELVNSIRLLRAYSRNPKSRAVLATLEGLFSVYEPFEFGGLIASSAGSRDIARLFNYLVEDSLYLKGSEAAHGLGISKKVIRSITLLRRYTEEIANSTRFRQLFSLGTKAVTAATKLPMPDSTAASELLSSGFLPPIVSLSNTMKAALDTWKESKSSPIYPPHINKRE